MTWTKTPRRSSRPALTAVLPIRDERESLPILLPELADVLRGLGRPFEILAVDDGSADGTPEVLAAEARRIQELRPILRSRPRGQGSALQHGFDEAKGGIVVSLDADLENDPGDIPRLLSALEKDGLDVVCGWRRGRGRPLGKRLASMAANGLRRLLIGETIHDVGCTLRVYRREALRGIRIEGSGHRMLTARLHLAGLSIGEVPVSFRPRRFGESKYDTLGRISSSAAEFARLAIAASARRRGAR